MSANWTILTVGSYALHVVRKLLLQLCLDLRVTSSSSIGYLHSWAGVCLDQSVGDIQISFWHRRKIGFPSQCSKGVPTCCLFPPKTHRPVNIGEHTEGFLDENGHISLVDYQSSRRLGVIIVLPVQPRSWDEKACHVTCSEAATTARNSARYEKIWTTIDEHVKKKLGRHQFSVTWRIWAWPKTNYTTVESTNLHTRRWYGITKHENRLIGMIFRRLFQRVRFYVIWWVKGFRRTRLSGDCKLSVWQYESLQILQKLAQRLTEMETAGV